MQKLKVIILYSEPMGYTIACLNEAAKVNRNSLEIHLIYWDKNKLTPYSFETLNFKHYPRSSFNNSKELLQFCIHLEPKAIFASGWMDLDYLKVSRYFYKRKINTITFIDNQWQGTLKQRISKHILGFVIKKIYKYAWVSGMRQYEYVRRLGYENENISWGFYCADSNLFNQIYNSRKKLIEKKGFNKSLVYLGRFADVKNIFKLIEAFRISELPQRNWTLTLIGNGLLEGEIRSRVIGERNIIIKEFMHPDHLEEELLMHGVFCLPSVFEPWGVVVHEFALAGFPLLISNQCGSKEHFLVEGHNGYSFNPKSTSSLVEKLNLIASSSEDELVELGTNSSIIANQINLNIWNNKFCNLIFKYE